MLNRDPYDFYKDEICTCVLRLKKVKRNGLVITERDCKVRIISRTPNKNGRWCYSVYNTKFKRYEKIVGVYLRLSPEETREYKLKKILK